MTHIRTQIRQEVVNLLKGNTVAGNKVYGSRIRPLDNLPAIAVFTLNEEAETVTISYPRTQSRNLNLAVEIYVKANTGFDDEADALAAEVEALLAADTSLGGLAKDIKLVATGLLFSGEGEKPAAIATLTYSVLYQTKENNPETLL